MMEQTNQLNITPELIFSLIKRRAWFILLPFFVAMIGGIFYIKTTPRIYEAKTTILVEGQRVPENYVQPIVPDGTSELINTISQQILSRTNLEKVIRKFSLFSDSDAEGMFMEDKVGALREAINVDVITADRRRKKAEAFEISFKGRDPEKIVRVLNGLASSFIEENVRVREGQATGTSKFLEAELESSRTRLEELEESIKNYRRVNMGQLPDQLDTNLRILERLQNNLSDRQQNLREAKIRLAELSSQARNRQPSVVVIGGGKDFKDGSATIDELISELKTLQSRYTEKHPDIIRLKKQIAEMESGLESKTAPVKNRIPYEIRTQIAAVKREIQVTQVEITSLQGQIDTYEQRIENIPKKEQELLTLKRDYENIQKSYDSLLNRKLEADIAVNMERKQKGEQFKIIDPARLPKRPVEPNIPRIFLLVVAVGLGAGGGLAFLREYMDSSFKKADELENAFSIPVLATIPVIEDHKQIIMRRLNTISTIVFALLNICLLGVFGLISLSEGGIL
jgi:polysaccharide chain length determinant protein (PEP-CTERM system associated)